MIINWSSCISHSSDEKARKPRYGVEEEPPIAIIVFSAIQHVGVIAIFMIYPLIVAREAGVPPAEIAAILRMGMLALAAGTVCQAFPRGRSEVGS